MVRSDNPIPDNIPLFYFEARIENEGKDGYAVVFYHLPLLFIVLFCCMKSHLIFITECSLSASIPRMYIYNEACQV